MQYTCDAAAAAEMAPYWVRFELSLQVHQGFLESFNALATPDVQERHLLMLVQGILDRNNMQPTRYACTMVSCSTPCLGMSYSGGHLWLECISMATALLLGLLFS